MSMAGLTQCKVVAYSDPRSLATTYVRNGFGEVIQETSPDAGVTTYVRDARGLIRAGPVYLNRCPGFLSEVSAFG